MEENKEEVLEKQQEAPKEKEEETKDEEEKTPEENEPEVKEAEEEKLSEEEKLRAELDEQKDKYLRVVAEYDNFRKRTAKERLELISTSKADAITQILPVVDNFERALSAQTQDETYKTGIEMIFKQLNEVLKGLGIEEINPIGEKFDPSVANAVNQIEDENLGDNEVAQVFQKGYRIGDKVLRYAMVVVANP